MNGKRKVIILFVLGLMIISMSGVGLYYWYENNYYVTSEDAKVTADIFRVSPQVAGKLLRFDVEEGQLVEQEQIMGRQELGSLPDSSLEQALIRAPISGLVIKKQGNVGEVVAPGQMLAMLIDPENLYISANIEETKLGRILPGQEVEITIDQFKDKKFSGKVKSIGQATAATFSLLPTSSGGNFTKVVQKVPVKIEFNQAGVKLLPGVNAIVKIQVK